MRKKNRVKVLLILLSFSFSLTAFSQQSGAKYGEDSVQCLVNMSLYRESYKQKNYKEAYDPWKWVLENCPMSSKNNFTNGPIILDAMIKAEKDSVKKEAYIQELFDLFELRIKCYPQDEGYALGQIGINIMKYRGYDWEKAYEIFNQAIDLSGTSTSPNVLNTFFITAERYMVNKQLTSEVMIDAYDKITEVLDYVTDKSEIEFDKAMRKIYDLAEELESEKITKDEFDVRHEDLAKDSAKTAKVFEQYKRVANNADNLFSKYANCEDLIAIYGKKLEQSKDERILRQILKFFNKENCTDNEIYTAAVEEIHKIEPTARTAFYMGINSYKKAEYQVAVNYFKEALNLFEKESDKRRTYAMLTESYKHLGQFSNAREVAYQNIKSNPTDPRAYVSLGDLYSTASCPSLDIPSAVSWVAADKYNKALSLISDREDPEQKKLYEDTQKKLNAAASRFPRTETYFQRGLSKGQSYKVECWVNETTSIR